MRFLISIVSSSLLIGQVMISPALACIGSGESYQIGFRESSKPGEQIVITRETKSGRYQEIVDDTGYVGIHLGITSLAKDADRNGKSVPASNATVQFLRSRAAHMKAYFNKNLPPEARRPVKLAEKLEQTLAKDPVSTDELVAAIGEFNTSLYDEKIEITAAHRKSTSEAFGEEVSVSDLSLPTYIRTRSAGCNAGIGVFNATPSKASSGSSPSSGGAPVTR